MNAETTKKDVAVAIDGKNLTINFSNGKAIKVAADALDAGIQDYAIMHGLKQKLVDAAAIARNTDTGKSATIEDKYNAVYAVYQRLLEGEWNKQREGGAGATGGLLLRALVRLYPRKSVEELKTYLAGKTPAEQAALRANVKVAKIIDEIRAERVTGVDSDDLLEELAD